MNCAKCGARLFKADIVRGNCFTCGCTIMKKEDYEENVILKKKYDEKINNAVRNKNFYIFFGYGEDMRIVKGCRVFNKQSIQYAKDWEQEICDRLYNSISDTDVVEISEDLEIDYIGNEKYYDGFEYTINYGNRLGDSEHWSPKNFKSRSKNEE